MYMCCFNNSAGYLKQLLLKRKNIKAWNDYFAITQTTGGPETQAIVGKTKTKNAIKDTEEHFYPIIVKQFILLHNFLQI